MKVPSKEEVNDWIETDLETEKAEAGIKAMSAAMMPDEVKTQIQRQSYPTFHESAAKMSDVVKDADIAFRDGDMIEAAGKLSQIAEHAQRMQMVATSLMTSEQEKELDEGREQVSDLLGELLSDKLSSAVDEAVDKETGNGGRDERGRFRKTTTEPGAPPVDREQARAEEVDPDDGENDTDHGFGTLYVNGHGLTSLVKDGKIALEDVIRLMDEFAGQEPPREIKDLIGTVLEKGDDVLIFAANCEHSECHEACRKRGQEAADDPANKDNQIIFLSDSDLVEAGAYDGLTSKQGHKSQVGIL